MRPISMRIMGFLALLLSAASAAQGADGLRSAYAAILAGDCQAGRAELVRLEAAGQVPASAAQVGAWLDEYLQKVDSRTEMKEQTFAWNVEQARQALAEGNVYLALSFAAQAAAYAPSETQYAAEPWIQELTTKALAEVAAYKESQQWRKVHASYTLLRRIHGEASEYTELRKQSARLARLEVLYKDQEQLERRIADVDVNLLRSAIRLVDKNYYQEPDFKSMAEGALDNLVALTQTRKLYDFLHGLGNPDTRQFFLERLEELRQWVRSEERFGYRDILVLYNRIAHQSTESVELPEGLLVTEFIEGALGRLDDYTTVVWPVDAPDFDKMMMGGFEGVGIQLSLDERTGRLKVVTPLEDSPALEAGIWPGDLIVEVDGESTKGWSTEDAVRNIMGPAGSPVVLTMFRPSTGERMSFKLQRRQIVLRTVRGVQRLPYDPQSWDYMIDRTANIAYLRVSGFHPDTHEEIGKALRAAQRDGMQGLILDLRHNPGGLLDVAVRAVSTFVDHGEGVSTGGRREARTSVRGTAEPLQVDVPMVVLVNEGSASASEILAGAFQDHGRAIVLGERTFGKGSVQRVLSLGNKARLKLTTALYYLPSGRSVHKAPEADEWGVTPDREVALTPKEFRQVLKRESDSYIIHNEDEGTPDDSAEREELLEALRDGESGDDDDPPLLTDAEIKALEADPVPAPEIDPQLETALLLLRVKLAANLPWPLQYAARSSDETL